MTVSDPVNPTPRSFAGDVLYALRYYLGGRIGYVAIAAAAFGLGAYFNWGWLVAAGIAPILVAVLPCAAMCALGLCMGGRSKGQTDEPASTQNAREETGEQSTLRLGASSDESHEASAASDRPAKATPRNRNGCC